VNDKTTGKIDLSKFSDEQLEELQPMIAKELETSRETRQKEAYEKMREIAEGVGMTPEELLGIGAKGGRRRRGGGSGAGRGKMLWQHPDDPSKEYRGGKKPDWLKELEAEGVEPLRVENL
jgi:hypothetical protein